jgi:hypothetical protein
VPEGDSILTIAKESAKTITPVNQYFSCERTFMEC